MKRFYQVVSLAPLGTGSQLLLDGKAAKTPAGNLLAVEHRRLGEAIADEWRAQDKKIELANMPMTRLAIGVADHVAPRMSDVLNDTLRYGATDLLCYRAETPERLVERQARAWQPFLDWAARDLDARLTVAVGVVAIDQDAASLAALRGKLASLDAYWLLVAQGLTMRFGSLLLALAVIEGEASALEAFEVSRIDETFQAEIWGTDAEAEKHVALIRREVENFSRFLSLLD